MPRKRSAYPTATTRTGASHGDRACRASATASPSTRINGSASRNSCTLIQKPSRISGNEAFACSQLKNVSCTDGHPGELRMAPTSAANTTTTAPVAMTIERVRSRLRSRRRSSSRVARLPPVRRHWSSGTSTTSESHCCSIWSSVPSSLMVGERLVHARDQLAALLEEHPELLLLAGVRLELPDQHAVRDLDGGDVEGGRQVGEDRVDLVVLQRLLGGVGVLEDQRVVSGWITSRMAVSEVVPVCAPSRSSCRSARLAASAPAEPFERDDGLRRVVVARRRSRRPRPARG